jgi:hypothetical protein
LKLEEEKILQMYSSDRLALVFRVFAATGRFMKSPSSFAIGDFLSSALNRDQITIKSRHQVYRSYVNVGCLMRLAWSILLDPRTQGYRLIEACSNTLSLHELACLISKKWSLGDPIANIDDTLSPDTYTGNENCFLSLLSDYHLEPPSLDEQLNETMQSVMASIGSRQSVQ